MEVICGIYMIKNKANNKIYIWQSVNIYKRWAWHKGMLQNGTHPNPHLQNAWNKYGAQNFEHSIIEICKPEELSQKEIDKIKEYNSNDPSFGYNMTEGGEGTRGKSEESINKFRKSFHKHIEDNPEWIENKRKQTLRQFQDATFYAEYISLRRSESFREKERQSHIGKMQTEETKEKIGKYFSKPVSCIETGVIYPSAREAGKAMPGNKNIQAAACGIRKTAAGYHWKYIDAT